MTSFRRVTDSFSVSPQISPADVAQAAAEGVTLIINNRPDNSTNIGNINNIYSNRQAVVGGGGGGWNNPYLGGGGGYYGGYPGYYGGASGY